MRWGRVAAAVLLAVGATWGGVTAWRGRADDEAPRVPGPPVTAEDSAARPPAGVRIRVQVLNATRIRGLARRATRHLRDRGFDVVEVGTSPTPRDSTVVLDRSGHPEWAERVARAMGGAPVEARRDSSRYLDVTVLVGRAWRPAAEPLDP
jgi:hypothetical protein